MLGTEIIVKYKATQGAEDLFVCIEGERKGRVYARQRMNVGDRVQWFTTSKWQGGYEADCHIKSGITMRVVDMMGETVFEETLVRDDWNSGTSAAKAGLFMDEWIRKIETEYCAKNELVSYEDWKKVMIEDQKKAGNNEYSDTWLYGYSEAVVSHRVAVAEYLDGPVGIYQDLMKHKISSRRWLQYEIRRKFDDVCLGLCGFQLK